MCHVRSDNITWIEVHHGILFDRRLVVINWKLSEQGFRWPVSSYRIAGSGADPSRLSIFWSYPLTSYSLLNNRRLNLKFFNSYEICRVYVPDKKTWQIMWRKRIVKWQPSKLLWIWIFGAVIKLRTTEKNYYLGRLLWSCLNPQAGFVEREKKLYWRIDCCSEWLHSLYCGCYCRINKPQLSIGEWLDRRMASRSRRNKSCLLS